ncbi:MAG: hypothetical protein ACRDOJ_07310 [Nocardioidaceae bacterium]
MSYRRYLLALAAVALAFIAGCATTASATAPTAEQVVTQLVQHVPTATPGIVFTAETDPNSLLGRPGGYTSKASFTDSRVPVDEVIGAQEGAVEYGGSVEIFDSERAAQQRKQYIDAFASIPLAVEYSYVSGPVLLRVSRALTPGQAAEYERALAETG